MLWYNTNAISPIMKSASNSNTARRSAGVRQNHPPRTSRNMRRVVSAHHIDQFVRYNDDTAHRLVADVLFDQIPLQDRALYFIIG